MAYTPGSAPYGEQPVVINPADSAVTIVDSNEVPINPAKEDGNLAGIKADTDALAALISSGALSVSFSPRFITHQDTYTAIAIGATVDRHTNPVSQYAMQITVTGVGNPSLNVVLEGSLDNVNFSTILNPKAVGMIFSGSLNSPVLYFRTRVISLNLNGATNIVVTVLAQ